jgi:hypothetical protein
MAAQPTHAKMRGIEFELRLRIEKLGLAEGPPTSARYDGKEGMKGLRRSFDTDTEFTCSRAGLSNIKYPLGPGETPRRHAILPTPFAAPAL